MSRAGSRSRNRAARAITAISRHRRDRPLRRRATRSRITRGTSTCSLPTPAPGGGWVPSAATLRRRGSTPSGASRCRWSGMKWVTTSVSITRIRSTAARFPSRLAAVRASDYGDIFDMMGSSNTTPHYNAFQKERLGWLNSGVSPPITTAIRGAGNDQPHDRADRGCPKRRAAGTQDSARNRRGGNALRRRLRAAVQQRLVSEGPERRRDGKRRGGARSDLAQVDGAGVHRCRSLADLSQQWNRGAGQRCLSAARGERVCRLPPGGRRARRAAGQPFAGGPARAAEPDADHAARLRRRLERHREVEGRTALSAARGGATGAPCAVRRVPLRRSHGSRRRQSLLREHRSRGCVHPQDYPGLRNERRGVARRQRRSGPIARRTAAGLQAREVRDAHRTGRKLRRDRGREGRLLGGTRAISGPGHAFPNTPCKNHSPSSIP